MNKSESIAELAKALAKAQAQFKPVKRSIKVDFTTKSGMRVKYNYAPLSDVIDSCVGILNSNELVIMQPTKVEENKIIVETMLIHSSGEWLSGELSIDPADHNPQSEGSALSYARRYALSSLLSIASDEDDDAEGAMVRDKPKATVKAEHKAESPMVAAAKEAGAVEREHWCNEHQTEFFKKGKMRAFAHPIEGSEGEDGKPKWCQEHTTSLTLGTIRAALSAKGFKTDVDQKKILMINDWKDITDLEGAMVWIGDLLTADEAKDIVEG